MSYTTGIPRSGQSLGNSRPQVNGNFDYINTAFAINHVAFNASGVGKHRLVDFVEQNSGDPTPTAGTEALFTKLSGPSTPNIGELFYKRSGGVPIQMTYGNPLGLQRGYSFLPGAVLIQWGFKNSVSSSGTVNFTDDGGINFNSSCFNVLITPSNGGSTPVAQITISVDASTLSASKFDWKRVGASTNYNGFYWMAIGV